MRELWQRETMINYQWNAVNFSNIFPTGRHQSRIICTPCAHIIYADGKQLSQSPVGTILLEVIMCIVSERACQRTSSPVPNGTQYWLNASSARTNTTIGLDALVPLIKQTLRCYTPIYGHSYIHINDVRHTFIIM